MIKLTQLFITSEQDEHQCMTDQHVLRSQEVISNDTTSKKPDKCWHCLNTFCMTSLDHYQARTVDASAANIMPTPQKEDNPNAAEVVGDCVGVLSLAAVVDDVVVSPVPGLVGKVLETQASSGSSSGAIFRIGDVAGSDTYGKINPRRH